MKKILKISTGLFAIAILLVVPPACHNFRYFSAKGIGEGAAERLLLDLHQRQIEFKRKNGSYTFDLQALDFTPDAVEKRHSFWNNNVVGFNRACADQWVAPSMRVQTVEFDAKKHRWSFWPPGQNGGEVLDLSIPEMRAQADSAFAGVTECPDPRDGFVAIAVHRVFNRIGIYSIDETGKVSVVQPSVPKFSYVGWLSGLVTGK